jgi:hypothetical protein
MGDGESRAPENRHGGGEPALARVALWSTVPVAASTEAGAVSVMWLGLIPGLAVALGALVLLELTLARIRPSEGWLRLALLVTGPPIRYGLLGLMAWWVWVRQGEGAGPAVAGVLALALVLPLLAMFLARIQLRRQTPGHP